MLGGLNQKSSMNFGSTAVIKSFRLTNYAIMIDMHVLLAVFKIFLKIHVGRI